MEKKPRLKKSRYITGFDGLRTIGVIGVILYHLRPELFKGGYLGVPIFMVVSGYLITDLLLQEFDQNNRIDFKGFFIRRVKRLYPGLIAVLFATSAYITLFSQNLLHNLHMMVITNLAYVYIGGKSLTANPILPGLPMVSRRSRICGHCRLRVNTIWYGRLSSSDC